MRGSRKTWLAVALIAGILIYECVVAWHEAKHPHIFGDLYVALSGFAGSYAPMPGQPANPSQLMAFGLTLALLTTFGAALTLVSALFRRELSRVRLLRARHEVVIVGSSPEADLIARSCDSEKNVARIFESGRGEEPKSLVLRAGQSLRENKAAVALVSSADTVIVAGSSDTLSARIATEVRQAMPTTAPFTLLRSDQMMSAMRPTVLEALPINEVFHPDDNVAQIVSECVARQANSHAGLPVHFLGDGSAVSSTVDVWCGHAKDSGHQIFGYEPWMLTNSLNDCELIVVSGNEEWVAAQVAIMTGSQPVIAVLSHDLLRALPLPSNRTILNWSDWASAGQPLGHHEILVVDPQQEGLSLRVIMDGLSSQWGRAFNDAYGFLYANSSKSGDGPAGAWDARTRNGQSSIAAAKFMLKNLRDHGYQLQRGNAGWHPDAPSDEVIEKMARAEHQDWRTQRTWVTNGNRVVSAPNKINEDGSLISNPHDVPFEDLDPQTRQYNLDVIARVYPALAAMFGYGIFSIKPGGTGA